ncbi:MAG: hypothetical protein P4L93_04180 [Coriobacteriia bacterium]|nr:hypothetical protein [Coriobacteriia bacterium]
MPETGAQHTPRSTVRHAHEKDLIPREFLSVIAVWSLIPAYVLAGAFLGWLVDRWLNTWPYGIGIGLFIALGLAVRDMIRLRDTL